jgi:uncharacterized protein with von Willebrand factor type A (vWA) domain
LTTTRFGLETLWLDLPATVGAFGRRLHEGGVPVTVSQSQSFARALTLVRPVSRRRLYCTARAVFVSDPSQVRAFDRIFADVFGATPTTETGSPDVATSASVPAPPDERPAQRSGADASGEPSVSRDGSAEQPSELEAPVPTLASTEEVLRTKRFEALAPAELAALYDLMARLDLATPRRRTRRRQRSAHGTQIDLRRTLRASLRTGGDPARLRHRHRRVVARRLVLLCDISGSMEPYARAYLQFLTCALGSGPRAEAFVFATRLTRITRALRTGSPERAIANAAAAAPDWSSGTRIGEALQAFNDLHGRRGMARGAVVVILSDGWERGEPALVAREMARLARLAHRIVWVNPRVAATEFVPRAGGMAAALPHCDALVSGHSLAALDEVVAAIAGADGSPSLRPEPPAFDDEQEPWASATPVPGSSVAMPSGYGPSRGRTTPGWSMS